MESSLWPCEQEPGPSCLLAPSPSRPLSLGRGRLFDASCSPESPLHFSPTGPGSSSWALSLQAPSPAPHATGRVRELHCVVLGVGGGGVWKQVVDGHPSFFVAGGPLTVTDANLCLGRLLPSHFPHIFGPDEKQPLSHRASLQAFQALTAEVKASGEGRPNLSVEEVAMGFIQVANEAMCRPIRALTQVPAPRPPPRSPERPLLDSTGPLSPGRRGLQMEAVTQVGRGSPDEQRPPPWKPQGPKSAGKERLL